MASGVCPLAYDYAAAAEVVRDLGNGATVPCGDEHGFIERAVQLGLADGLRTELARAARATAETIDWERVNDGFAEALSRAWRSGTTSPPAAAALRTREAES